MMNSKREIGSLCKLLFSFFKINQPQILHLLKKSRPYLRNDPLVFLNFVSFSLKNYNFKNQNEDCELLEFYTVASLKGPDKKTFIVDWGHCGNEVLTVLDEEERDTILFSCLSIYNDS